MQQLERTYIDCECESIDHVIRFTYDPDDKMLWAEVMLKDYLPWYKRLVIGVKYIFGSRAQYSAYDVTIIKPADYDRFLELINKAKNV